MDGKAMSSLGVDLHILGALAVLLGVSAEMVAQHFVICVEGVLDFFSTTLRIHVHKGLWQTRSDMCTIHSWRFTQRFAIDSATRQGCPIAWPSHMRPLQSPGLVRAHSFLHHACHGRRTRSHALRPHGGSPCRLHCAEARAGARHWGRTPLTPRVCQQLSQLRRPRLKLDHLLRQKRRKREGSWVRPLRCLASLPGK